MLLAWFDLCYYAFGSAAERCVYPAVLQIVQWKLTELQSSVSFRNVKADDKCSSNEMLFGDASAKSSPWDCTAESGLLEKRLRI